ADVDDGAIADAGAARITVRGTARQVLAFFAALGDDRYPFVVAELRNQQKGRSCAVVPSDLRLWIEAAQHYLYPDVTVVCGEPEFTDDHTDTLVNPTLIVEVLSKSTKDFDRGEKFTLYRTLPSFAEYVLIAQDRHHVEHIVRQADGRWILADIDRLESTVSLASIEGRLALAEIYDKVTLPARRVSSSSS
ncbi:MAG: Uma2 family endonuclease, partial [Actinomycetia bacterium]|nr:Uma2 family endonuclease [Actinomycetes bacterium]